VWSVTPTSCHDLICEKCRYERTACRRSAEVEDWGSEGSGGEELTMREGGREGGRE
jgi:hypothetical protein